MDSTPSGVVGRHRWVLTLLRVAIGAAVLVWILATVQWTDVVDPAGRVRERGLLSVLAGVRWTGLSVAIALFGAATLAGVVRYAALLRAQGAEVSLGLAARLTYVGLFFNLGLPGANGGDLVKAGWAARATGSVSKSVAATALDRVVGLFCLTLLAAIPAVAAIHDPAYTLVGIICGSVLVGAVAFVALYLCPPVRRLVGRARQSDRRVFQALAALDDAVVAYRRTPGALLVAAACSVGGQLCVIGSIWGLAAALGLPAVNWLVVAPAVMIVAAVPIAPGGVGQTEGAFTWFLVPLLSPMLAGGRPEAVAEAVALGICFRFLVLLYGCAGGVVLCFARPAPVDTSAHAPDSAAS